MPTEIKSHTALRGIAALLVIIFHYRTVFSDPDRYTQFLAKGYLWVDCFFMLSGFILCHVYGTRPARSSHERERFLLARFARIYPLHVATLLFLGLYVVLLPKISHQHFDANWSTFLLNLYGVHAWGLLDAYDWNFPSWSISVEFAAYFAFPIICLGIDRARRLTFLALLLTFVAACFIGHENWERIAIIRGVPMFFAGILIFYFWPAMSDRLSTIIQVIAFAGLVMALHFGIKDVFVDLMFIALVGSTRSDAGASKVLAIRPLMLLGSWSYSIYMLHIPVRYIIALIAPNLDPIMAMIAMLTMTLLLGAGSYYFFERPIRDLLTGRGRRSAVDGPTLLPGVE